jgi:hypothetical protein
MAPLNDHQNDASKPKKRGRGPSKKENKNEEEAKEVFSEKVSTIHLHFVSHL